MELNVKLPENNGWSGSLTIKLILIGFMVILLLIPLSMIENVIHERESTANAVEAELSNQWGTEQTLAGPVLNIPVLIKSNSSNTENGFERKWLHIMPAELSIQTTIDPQIRKRGIYENVVYTSKNKISGHFENLTVDDPAILQVEWQNACLTFGINDNRGIRGEVSINWQGEVLPPESGMVTKDLASSGFSAKTPLTESESQSAKKFTIDFDLCGSQAMWFLPIGKKTSIDVESSWKDPSFTGSFLPQERSITHSGFTARWNITHLNRNFPQQWIGNQFNIKEQQLGVNLYKPVNHYQKSYRSSKYGILFISLTVLVFMFIELTKKKKIHLFQYLLVGLALVLFFSVLTALSEQVGFNAAYLIASITIIGMITGYTYQIMRDKVQTLWVLSLLMVLYAFLFVLLQLNDYAFLAGNIGLLIALGVIMKASLKLPGDDIPKSNMDLDNKSV